MLYLIGYSGVGKSSIGKILAKDLNLKFIDTDELIEQQYKKSINDIFTDSGEKKFRKIESEIIKKIKNKNIVACGGGLPCFNKNMEFITRFGTSIYLKASTDELYRRLKVSLKIRPLLANKTEEEIHKYIKKTIKTREKFYKKANYTIDTDGLMINKVLTKIYSLPITF